MPERQIHVIQMIDRGIPDDPIVTFDADEARQTFARIVRESELACDCNDEPIDPNDLDNGEYGYATDAANNIECRWWNDLSVKLPHDQTSSS